MAVIVQPGLGSNDGLVASIGFVSNGDRWEIVIPFATDTATNPVTAGHNLAAALESIGIPLLLPIFSSDTSLVFIQVESMVHGRHIPDRFDYSLGTHVGSRASTCMPTSNAGLADYYVDPTQQLAGQRVRIAKNFFAGIAQSDVTGDIVASVVIAAIAAFCEALQNGTIVDTAGTKWYRVGAAVRTAATTLANIVAIVVRDYIATQRRRLTPR